MATAKQTSKQQDHNNAIQKSVSQEATKAQCGNQGSLQPGETNCENGSKAKRQEATGGQGPLRVRSRVLCLSSA